MVRINLVEPKDMHWKHLMAERYEILEIPRNIKNGRYKLEGIPPFYKLWEGHKKFFYNKLKYLHKRYVSLHKESLKRGYKVKNFEYTFDELDILVPELYNDYNPTDKEYNFSKDLLQSKIDAKPHIFWEFTVKPRIN